MLQFEDMRPGVDSGGGAARVPPIAVSAGIAVALVDALRSRGVDPGPALAEAGVHAEVLSDPEATFPKVREEALWRAAIAAAGTTVGLDAARTFARGAFGPLEYAVRSGATLGDGLRQLARFSHLLHGGEPLFELGWTDGTTVLRHRSPHAHAPAIRDAAADLALGAALLVLRGSCAASIAPTAARLERAPPADPGPWRALFGASVELGASASELVFDARAAASPCAASDPALHAMMVRWLERAERERGLGPSWVARVRAVVTQRLGHGAPELDRVARILGVSSRSLQRRLHETGTSYARELDAAREEHARLLLRDPSLKMEEVAARVGYSEVSTFHRAFRRWTGTTPGRWRAKPR